MKKYLFFIFSFIVSSNMLDAQRPIITKWNTNINNDNSTQILINTSGAYNYSWQSISNPSQTGSGTGNDGLTTINFPSPGIYSLQIQPVSIFKFYFMGTGYPNVTNNVKLIELSQWGDVNWNTDLSGLFSQCYNLTISAQDIPDFSGVTNFMEAFSSCFSLNDIPNAGQWDVSNVTNMNSMFQMSLNFNGNIGSWDTSSVEQMAQMFSGCYYFNQDIGNWDTSQVTNMNSMFEVTNFFNQDISGWDVSSVTNISKMFAGAIEFNQNLGNWNLNSLSSSIEHVAVFSNTAMDCNNYSQTLMGWSENPNIATGVQLISIGPIYGDFAVPYRNNLITNKGWTFSGDTYDAGCVVNMETAETVEFSTIRVYPNPATEFIRIESNSGIRSIEIFNANQKLVKAEKSSVNQLTIPLSGLPIGVYFIRIQTDIGMESFKLIKK
ncbi:MAG: BspA family leucine-rich repeat surface protein [Flavobacteriaceae bacterium]|nr:BspA family leucine-rich repeat surface protein [Flavobacteriaceae bacterium]